MRAYTTLRELVKSAGSTLVEEHLHPESFGSAYAVFVGHAGAKFRVVWDGKEGCGFLQAESPNQEWKDTGPYVRERLGQSFSDLPEFLAMVERLASSPSQG